FWSALRDAALGIGRRASVTPVLANGGGLTLVGTDNGPTALADPDGSPYASRAWRPGGPKRTGRPLHELALGERLVSEGRLQAVFPAKAHGTTRTLRGHLPLDRPPATHRQLQLKYRIGDLLVETNVITEGQLEDAVREQRRNGLRLGEVLIHLA